MKFRCTDGEGYFSNDNRNSGGAFHEGGILGCVHCSAAIHRGDVEKPKTVETTGLTIRARCWPCDGYLCPECGFATYLHGHNNPDHARTWPHHLWLQRGIDDVYRREQNAKV